MHGPRNRRRPLRWNLFVHKVNHKLILGIVSLVGCAGLIIKIIRCLGIYQVVPPGEHRN